MAISTIQSGGQQRPGFSETLLQSFLQSMMAEKENKIRKEQLKLHEREVAIAEQDAARRQAEADAAARARLGEQAAAQFTLAQFLQSDPSAASQIARVQGADAAGRIGMSALRGGTPSVPTTPRPISGQMAQALVPQLQQLRDFQSTQALRGQQITGAELDNRFGASTLTARIETANLQPSIASTQLAGAQAAVVGQRIQNSLDQLRLENDPQRVSMAATLLNAGVPWGEARRTVRLAAGGIPDDFKLVPAGTDAANQEATRAQGFATVMTNMNGTINQIHAQGVRLGLLPSMQLMTRFQTFDAFVNTLSSPEQQALVHAYRTFGDMYRTSLSGQQSTDREALRMMRSIAEQSGDSEQTIAAKRVLRETMIEVTAARANGTMTPLSAAQAGLNAARGTRDPEIIAIYEGIVSEVVARNPGVASMSGANAASQPPSTAPIDASTIGTTLDPARLDALLGISE